MFGLMGHLAQVALWFDHSKQERDNRCQRNCLQKSKHSNKETYICWKTKLLFFFQPEIWQKLRLWWKRTVIISSKAAEISNVRKKNIIQSRCKRQILFWYKFKKTLVWESEMSSKLHKITYGVAVIEACISLIAFHARILDWNHLMMRNGCVLVKAWK